ncbi:sex-regulated protein janus-A-like isoform X2 [Bactrocera tryoni]|uniref:sex-regulated protein janus-A-like isoform X2 n=1 Tax=Bactrocera tryoni TaxID=59916 RepID=UPI001A95DF96|nr:sex-regulated protein janus-A-like isoform X2 [Bactrocera tryoni]
MNYHSQFGMYSLAIRLIFQKFSKMAGAKLEAVPSVDIEEGVFKYVLIKVFGNDDSINKNIVRGYADCQWHSDIYDRASESCKGLGLETECLGGGRIEHSPNLKLIKVYGYSQGFGKADHAETRRILLNKYPLYSIEISDEGY